MKRTVGSNLFFRLSIIMAIVASFTVCGLALLQVKKQILNLQSILAAQTAARQNSEVDLAKARSDLITTAATLKELRANLQATTLEKQQAQTTAAAQAKKAAETLATVSQQRDEAQATLARYRAAGMEPEQITTVARQIKALQINLVNAEKTNQLLSAKIERLNRLIPGDDGATWPSELHAKVLASDPKWRFVVLDAGEDKGVLENGEILLSRQGKLLAKAKISRVHKERSIANIVPGWEFADVVEGDSASAAPTRF